jgi:hypothetical protein
MTRIFFSGAYMKPEWDKTIFMYSGGMVGYLLGADK